MSFTILHSDDRGRSEFDWLDSWHSFSFGDYHDPQRMGFGPLRVINEDIVAPGAGFPMHPHKNMEIITYIISGTLEHKDSLGNESVIRPGEIQVMSAGKGILHSEFNPSQSSPVHLLQIWIMPARHGEAPGYQQSLVDLAGADNQFIKIVSGDGTAPLSIKQDAAIYTARPIAGKDFSFVANASRKYWLQMTQGVADINDHILQQGDALAIENEFRTFNIKTETAAEILLFDLPP